jgi:hypothetical protein
MSSEAASTQPGEGESRAATKGARIDPGLVNASVLRSRRDAPWALLADAALVVFAVELAVRFKATWGLGVLAGAALALGMQLSRYRYRASAAAGQVKLAAGLVMMAASVAFFLEPRAWVSICVLGATGVVKLVREVARYVSLRRRMLETGRRRKRNVKMAAVSAAVFLVAAALAWSGARNPVVDMRVPFVAWLAGYSLVSVAMELWA